MFELPNDLICIFSSRGTYLYSMEFDVCSARRVGICSGSCGALISTLLYQILKGLFNSEELSPCNSVLTDEVIEIIMDCLTITKFFNATLVWKGMVHLHRFQPFCTYRFLFLSCVKSLAVCSQEIKEPPLFPK